MIAGTIKLMNHHGLIVGVSEYRNKIHRHSIVEKWEKEYGPQLEEEQLFLQVVPLAYPDRVRFDGTNKRSRRIKDKEEDVEVKPTRPPANYSNERAIDKYYSMDI